MNKGVWEEAVREDANKKNMESCNRCKKGVHVKKREGVSVVKRRKGGGERVCKGIVEEGIHLAIEVTTNGASILCREERWKEADSARL